MGDNTTDAITPFLKARRAALDPRDLGFDDGPPRRRVHGLRREEVAQRAGISVDYYTRIEQGRAHGMSDSVLDAIARALRLTAGEHSYLRNITRPAQHGDHEHSCELADHPRPIVPAAAQDLLDALDPASPAMIYGPGHDLLAWNRSGGVVTFDLERIEEAELNSALLIFNDPGARELFPDWQLHADETVATLRGDLGRQTSPSRLNAVIHRLHTENADFRRAWEAQRVAEQSHGHKRIRNPHVGDLDVTFQAFPIPAAPHLRLCVYTAPAGSVTAERLQRLAALVPEPV
ncbi:helix-turn-helix domain-containing protein [Microlunatus soli]|uniref:Helix-turn-helix domain-containing protein n=1 Tax=Microlunatus soli TaxID=630515 RepID=A0A1H1Y546_9ACTN|nr:helix-turn-helix domain-containing protein [Microlunatus soli]SDT16502.1 Helix-turn-helix domain-containing protein [Microlunatus soli]